jgi:hypothetical protein
MDRRTVAKDSNLPSKGELVSFQAAAAAGTKPVRADQTGCERASSMVRVDSPRRVTSTAVIHPETLQVDRSATAALRKTLRKETPA